MTLYYNYLESDLGRLLLLANENALTGLYFEGQKYFPRINSAWQYQPQMHIFRIAAVQIQEYLNGQRFAFTIPYQFISGTSFQQNVWQQLALLTYGTTISYTQLAERINAPNSVRAVGAAVGRNPLIMVIPCQRVISSSGKLTGYAAGLACKKLLLELEQCGVKQHQKVNLHPQEIEKPVYLRHVKPLQYDKS